jgi:hypothetical protein
MHSLQTPVRLAPRPDRWQATLIALLFLVLGLAACDELDEPASPDAEPASADSPGQAPVSPQAAAAKVGTGVREALRAGEEARVIITFDVPGTPESLTTSCNLFLRSLIIPNRGTSILISIPFSCIAWGSLRTNSATSDVCRKGLISLAT